MQSIIRVVIILLSYQIYFKSMINLLNTSTSNMMIVLFSCSKSTPGQTTTNAQAMTSQLQVTNPNAQVSESFKHVSELLDHVSTSHSTMIQHIQVRVVNLDATTMSTVSNHAEAGLQVWTVSCACVMQN